MLAFCLFIFWHEKMVSYAVDKIKARQQTNLLAIPRYHICRSFHGITTLTLFLTPP
jgi:hypothetical protein